MLKSVKQNNRKKEGRGNVHRLLHFRVSYIAFDFNWGLYVQGNKSSSKYSDPY